TTVPEFFCLVNRVPIDEIKAGLRYCASVKPEQAWQFVSEILGKRGRGSEEQCQADSDNRATSSKRHSNTYACGIPASSDQRYCDIHPAGARENGESWHLNSPG